MNQDFHSIFQKNSQHSRSIRKFKKSIDSPHDDTGITDEVLRELMHSTILSSGGNHLPHEYLMPSKNDSPETSEWVNGMHSFIHSHLFDCLKGVPEDEDIREHHIVKPIMHATIHFIRNNPHPLLTKSSSVLLDMIKLFELQSEKLGKLSNKFYYQKPKIIEKSFSTPAWQRKEGQNPKGGLNAKGRASAKREGHNLKSPVKSGDNPRRASFLARMGASPGPEHDEQGKPTRLLLALQAWGASSKADARRKAKQISKRLEQKRKSNHDR